MNTRLSFVLAALALVVASAAPAMAQEADAEKEEAAAKHAAMMESHAEMASEGEACQCACMSEMHEKMMKAHADDDDRADGEGHEGMESDEGHAEMMQAHMEMMAGCECMAGEKGEGEHAMSCQMHGAHGEMKGEGMQHRHGMDTDSDDSESETDGDG